MTAESHQAKFFPYPSAVIDRRYKKPLSSAAGEDA
jgi:hypothetical protein